MQLPFSPSQRVAWSQGQPISELMARALANPKLISLAAGFVDQQTLPADLVRQAFDALMADQDTARSALQYGDTPGFGLLREMLAARAAEADQGAGAPEADQIVLTAGSNQLLHLVSECLLNPGDIVLCAAPTYLVFLGTAANLGARTMGVASDELGVVPAALEERLAWLEKNGQLPLVKAIYITTYFDNPRGVTMPLERRAQVVDVAKRWSRVCRIHVVADSAYRELRYEGDDIPSTRTVDEEGDTVIVAGTFSKSFSPGVRVGWGILPPHLVAPVCSQKGNFDFGSPNFNQHLMAKAIECGLFDRHVQRIRESYREKLQAMLTAADEFLAPLKDVHWLKPQGGLYVWVTLPPEIDAGPSAALFDAAIQAGLLYVPGQYCFPGEGEPVRTNTIRLSFGVQTPEKIRQGMQILADAIRAATN